MWWCCSCPSLSKTRLHITSNKPSAEVRARHKPPTIPRRPQASDSTIVRWHDSNSSSLRHSPLSDPGQGARQKRPVSGSRGSLMRSSRLLEWQSRESARRCCAPWHRWRDLPGPGVCCFRYGSQRRKFLHGGGNAGLCQARGLRAEAKKRVKAKTRTREKLGILSWFFTVGATESL